MIDCVCVISMTEHFWIICFRSEAVVYIYIYSMGFRVNCNRRVPHYNSSSILPMTISHVGYKLFAYCIILFDKLEIGAIPGE